MNKELCFCFQDRNLYLEQVLVDYMDIPIFFLCKDEDDRYYVVLCTDIEELDYIVVHAATTDIYKLLHGKIPMRNIFFRKEEFWKVISGEEAALDSVIKCSADQLDTSVLPEERACFDILTEEMSEYVRRFDKEFLEEKFFIKSEKTAIVANSRETDRWMISDLANAAA